MNRERKERFNDVIDMLEDASARGDRMQEYIDLMDECEGKIDDIEAFIQNKLMK